MTEPRSIEDLSPQELAQVEAQAEAERARRADKAYRSEQLTLLKRQIALLESLEHQAKKLEVATNKAVGFKASVIGDVTIGVALGIIGGMIIFAVLGSCIFGSGSAALLGGLGR